jgi:predicted transcriptional regulator
VGLSSSIDNTIRVYKDSDKYRDKETDYHNKAIISRYNGIINGINTPSTSHTVFKISGSIPLTPSSDSVIIPYSETPEERKSTPHMEKSPLLKALRYRSYGLLHIHRLEALVEVPEAVNVNEIVEDLTKILQYEEVKVNTPPPKERYKHITYKEKRGESINHRHYFAKKKDFIKLITHKTWRIKEFLKYMKMLGVNEATIKIELYVRYSEYYEMKIVNALNALCLEFGDKCLEHKKPFRGKFHYFWAWVKIEYQGIPYTLKSYRHLYYRDYKPTNPEYHPKVEASVSLKKIPIHFLDIDTVIKKHGVLLNTLLHVVNPRVILGEYELKETETTQITIIDRDLARIIRGITRRLKLESLIEIQFGNKEDAIAHLLVERGMTPSQIVKMGLYSKSMIYKIIDKLINNGVIVRVSRGKYKWNNRKAISISKKRLVESRQMTPQQLLEFAKEKKPRIVHDRGTLVIEYEDEYTIREIIVDNITVYDNMVIVRIMGKPLVWKITRDELRRLITMH